MPYKQFNGRNVKLSINQIEKKAKKKYPMIFSIVYVLIGL